MDSHRAHRGTEKRKYFRVWVASLRIFRTKLTKAQRKKEERMDSLGAHEGTEKRRLF
jgi:hypothetical protein